MHEIVYGPEPMGSIRGQDARTTIWTLSGYSRGCCNINTVLKAGTNGYAASRGAVLRALTIILADLYLYRDRLCAWSGAGVSSLWPSTLTLPLTF